MSKREFIWYDPRNDELISIMVEALQLRALMHMKSVCMVLEAEGLPYYGPTYLGEL